MFSKRLPVKLALSPLARLIETRRSALLDLTSSNPTRNGFVYPENEILAALTSPRSLTYEPHPLGILDARQAVAQMYNVHPERVVLSSSTSEAYSWLFKLMCDPGDEILIPRPSYPLFEILAGLDSVATRTYSLRYHEGWFIDMQSLRDALTPRTRFVIVVNPNNPTGSFITTAEQSQLQDICAQREIALISDEVFQEYPLSGKPVTLLGNIQGLTFVLGGLSKLAGLPQMKLAWTVVCGPPARCKEALARLELIADSYLSPSAPVQHALPALLQFSGSIRDQISEQNKANLEWVRFVIRGGPVSLLETEGGWNAILRVPHIRTEEEWVALLIEQAGVLVQPGYFYDMDGGAFLVVSLLTPPAIFQEGITRVLQASAGETRGFPE